MFPKYSVQLNGADINSLICFVKAVVENPDILSSCVTALCQTSCFVSSVPVGFGIRLFLEFLSRFCQ